jgi:hypothetical protein
MKDLKRIGPMNNGYSMLGYRDGILGYLRRIENIGRTKLKN